jgi:hypothetical protein
MLMPKPACPTPMAAQPPAAHTAALARLLPLWPHELSDQSTTGRERRLSLLRKALRAERRRGLAGHWTYDLGRHSALLRCYRHEAALAAADGHSTSPNGFVSK